MNLYIDAKYSNGLFLTRLTKQRMALDASGMVFPKNHKLFEIFDRKIQQLLSGGIINHYTEEWFQYLNPKRYAHLKSQDPEVLKMSDLEAGFMVWLITILIATLAFLFEWIFRSQALMPS
jgi:hypothetical protein